MMQSDTVRIRKGNVTIDSLVLANAEHSVVVDGVLGNGENAIVLRTIRISCIHFLSQHQ